MILLCMFTSLCLLFNLTFPITQLQSVWLHLQSPFWMVKIKGRSSWNIPVASSEVLLTSFEELPWYLHLCSYSASQRWPLWSSASMSVVFWTELIHSLCQSITLTDQNTAYTVSKQKRVTVDSPAVTLSPQYLEMETQNKTWLSHWRHIKLPQYLCLQALNWTLAK